MWVTLAMCFSNEGVGLVFTSVNHASEMTLHYLQIPPPLFSQMIYEINELTRLVKPEWK